MFLIIKILCIIFNLPYKQSCVAFNSLHKSYTKETYNILLCVGLLCVGLLCVGLNIALYVTFDFFSKWAWLAIRLFINSIKTCMTYPYIKLPGNSTYGNYEINLRKNILNDNTLHSGHYVVAQQLQRLFYRFTVTKVHHLYQLDTPDCWIRPFNPSSKNILIRFHGGGYLFHHPFRHPDENIFIHDQLNKELDFNLFIMDYKQQYPNSVYDVCEKYINLRKKYPDYNFYLFGESAGAHIIIMMINHLIDTSNQRWLPKNIILLSPWLMGEEMYLENENDWVNNRILQMLKQRHLCATKNNTHNSYSPQNVDIMHWTPDKFKDFPPVLLYCGHEYLAPESFSLLVKLSKHTSVAFRQFPHGSHALSGFTYSAKTRYYMNVILSDFICSVKTISTSAIL